MSTERPAPGFRNAHSGTTGLNGNRGYSWSSSVDDANGFRLYFSATWMTNDANYRAYGFPLRCLSE
ncbi:hypothetical protein [uncultured Rikenella sp.]|uniref:hypothetical protein n=1 Tax=uncultured Rikenella sp. TaxID=368003 RepID=UPI00261BCA70|nr:hypothetical protein [uncultured Rikenella sp.]